MSFFTKLTNAFKTNEDHFRSARTNFIIEKVNKIYAGETRLTNFLHGVKGRSIILPDEAVLKDFVRIDRINIAELCLYLVYISLGDIISKRNDEKFFTTLNHDLYHKLVEEEVNIGMTKDDFNSKLIIASKYFKDTYFGPNSLPGIEGLYNSSFDFSEANKFDNLFNAYFNVLGFYIFIAKPIVVETGRVLNKFLQDYGCSGIKSIEDIFNEEIVKEVYNKNRQIQKLPDSTIFDIQVAYFTSVNSCSDGSFLTNDKFMEAHVDWFKLMLLYNGYELEPAKKIIDELKVKLRNVSPEWDAYQKVATATLLLDQFGWSHRYKITDETIGIIVSLIFDVILDKDIDNFKVVNDHKDPVTTLLSHFTHPQRMSFMNLLLAIATCDDAQKYPEKEIQYLNNYLNHLKVNKIECTDYLRKYGTQQMFNDLTSLSDSEKEFVIAAVYELICSDGPPNSVELGTTENLLSEIGIDSDRFVMTIQSIQTRMRHMMTDKQSVR